MLFTIFVSFHSFFLFCIWTNKPNVKHKKKLPIKIQNRYQTNKKSPLETKRKIKKKTKSSFARITNIKIRLREPHFREVMIHAFVNWSLNILSTYSNRYITKTKHYLLQSIQWFQMIANSISVNLFSFKFCFPIVFCSKFDAFCFTDSFSSSASVSIIRKNFTFIFVRVFLLFFSFNFTKFSFYVWAKKNNLFIWKRNL